LYITISYKTLSLTTFISAQALEIKIASIDLCARQDDDYTASYTHPHASNRRLIHILFIHFFSLIITRVMGVEL
jgi:hypothetical protein